MVERSCIRGSQTNIICQDVEQACLHIGHLLEALSELSSIHPHCHCFRISSRLAAHCCVQTAADAATVYATRRARTRKECHRPWDDPAGEEGVRRQHGPAWDRLRSRSIEMTGSLPIVRPEDRLRRMAEVTNRVGGVAADAGHRHPLPRKRDKQAIQSRRRRNLATGTASLYTSLAETALDAAWLHV